MNDIEITDKYGYGDYDYLIDVLNYTLEKLHIDEACASVILTDDEEVHYLNGGIVAWLKESLPLKNPSRSKRSK